MTAGTLLIATVLLLPLIGAVVCLLPLGSRWYLRTGVAVAAGECIAALTVLHHLQKTPRIYGFQKLLFIDTLSFYHIALVVFVFFIASIYATGYFKDAIINGTFPIARLRRFAMIWNAFFAVLLAVLCANNMGILWICLEATTLVSALLIFIDGKPASIEAMWKYLLICSVGIALAFVGTLLLSVAAHGAAFIDRDALLWTSLYDHRTAGFNPTIMLIVFIFILVGFGTKAGLAPMHTWLPDAHSQAPTPVSAVFSGIMLSCALYCIMRYLPLCEAALGGSGRPHAMLTAFGLLSLFIAALFIPAQKNVKRFLAYSSVEHIGIIAIGLGLGGMGTFAALFHTLNHAVTKPLAFFAAGALQKQHGTYDMRHMYGSVIAQPLWGTAFFIALLALIGAAPFSLFMSELQLVMAAIDQHKFVVLVLFFLGATAVFVSALRHAIGVAWNHPRLPATTTRWPFRDQILVGVCVALMLAGGLFLPHEYTDLLRTAAAIIEGVPELHHYATGVLR